MSMPYHFFTIMFVYLYCATFAMHAALGAVSHEIWRREFWNRASEYWSLFDKSNIGSDTGRER